MVVGVGWIRNLLASTLFVALVGCSTDSSASASDLNEAVEQALGIILGEDGILPDAHEIGDFARSCMQQRGYSYEGSSEESTERVPLVALDELRYDQEWVSQQGYGIAEAAAVRQPGNILSSDEPSVEVSTGLSPSARRSYSEALDRCHQEWQDWLAAEFRSLNIVMGFAQRDLDTIGPRVMASPKVMAAMQSWSDCMSASGYSFSDIEEPPQSFSQKLNELRYDPVEDQSEHTLIELSPAQITLTLDEGLGLPEDELADLMAEEIRVATISLRCGADAAWSIRNETFALMLRDYFSEITPELKKALDS